MFEMSSEKPVKKRTPTPAAGENCAAGTMPSLIVAMTFRPMVHAPTSANTLNSPAAVAFRTSLLPTAGPNATPVEEPPMLNPTNAATMMPTTARTVTTSDSTPLGRRVDGAEQRHSRR